MARIAFLGNFKVDYSTETHHVQTLESMGHTVFRLQETQTNSEKVFKIASTCDLLRTLMFSYLSLSFMSNEVEICTKSLHRSLTNEITFMASFLSDDSLKTFVWHLVTVDWTFSCKFVRLIVTFVVRFVIIST